MSFMTQLTSIFDTFSAAKRMSHLMSMSDHQLQARGLDRDALKRGFIAGIGSR